jgi:DNA helicase-2/ATP-dependent DNA helicase PcrA
MSSEAVTADPESEARNLLVIAPPGCGKTELLARRADFLIRSLQPGQRILALTFSNKAKANLNERLVSVLGAERKRRFVTVHNFHGHAAEIIQSHGRVLEIPTDVKFPDKRTQDNAIDPYLEGLLEDETHEIRASISDQLRVAKQGPFTDGEVLRRLDASAESRTKEVEAHRQKDGALFYDDLLRHAQRLLRVRGAARLYRAHYAAVLVDEFQDLSPQQLDIALRSCDASRTFVGDPLQGIYSWAGARPIQVERLLRRIGGKPLGLGVSYRSSPKVLNLLGIISQQLGGQALASHEPDRWHEGGVAAGAMFATGVDEAAFIRQTALAILDRDPSSTIGVICRSGWRRKPIDHDFASSGTPCTRWDLAVDNPQIVDLITTGIARLGGAPKLQDLETELISTVGANDVDTTSDIRDALGQLRELAEHAGSIAAALAQLRVRDDATAAVAPGVHLLNAHTGKGQQFDWVFIPGLEDGNVPSFLAKGNAALEEEKRVLLVMISRAKHGVIISRAGSLVSKKGKTYSTKPSPWANSIRAGLDMDPQELLQHISRFPEPSP